MGSAGASGATPVADRYAAVTSELCSTAERAGWSGPDIYDALDARWPTLLSGGKRRRQALLQLHARSPVDLRPLTRRSHRRIAKALALFAMADLRLARLTGADPARGRVAMALQLLSADRSAGSQAWGYPWDMQTRWSFYERDTPNVIVTAFAIRALAEGGEALGHAGHAARAAAGGWWVQEELFDARLGAYVYHPGSGTVIHNANLLGARAAWSIGEHEPAVRNAVERAVARTLDAQRPDGSFAYGEGPGLGFVDSFHTAYVLECLLDLRRVDSRIDAALERGVAFYAGRFFDARGRALLWPGRAYPEDGHSAGSGLTALARLAGVGLVSSELVRRVADRAAVAMVRHGHAVHRRHRWGPTRVTYIRWADAHMALGMANAALSFSADAQAPPAPADSGR